MYVAIPIQFGSKCVDYRYKSRLTMIVLVKKIYKDLVAYIR
jgi:hypothetical protein